MTLESRKGRFRSFSRFSVLQELSKVSLVDVCCESDDIIVPSSVELLVCLWGVLDFKTLSLNLIPAEWIFEWLLQEEHDLLFEHLDVVAHEEWSCSVLYTQLALIGLHFLRHFSLCCPKLWWRGNQEGRKALSLQNKEIRQVTDLKWFIPFFNDPSF